MSEIVQSATILVVEDDRNIREAACKYLEKHGFTCIALAQGAAVPAHVGRCDLILLDLNLPDIDGLKVLSQVREKSRIPILIVSARGESRQRILGLDLGADDYLPKPVLPGEMLARVKALLRRSKPLVTSAPESNWSFDEKARLVTTDRHEIPLTEQEFELLRFLAESPGQAFTRQELLNLVWREESGLRTRRVDLMVSRIRNKFIDRQLEPPVESVWKVGYRFVTAV